VTVVTTCTGNEPVDVIKTIRENRASYASQHGYELRFFPSVASVQEGFLAVGLGEALEGIKANDAEFFWRAKSLLLSLLERRQQQQPSPQKTPWLLWLDCSALLTDPALPVDLLLHREGVAEDHSVIATADDSGIRPEALLLKSSDFSLISWRSGCKNPQLAGFHPMW